MSKSLSVVLGTLLSLAPLVSQAEDNGVVSLFDTAPKSETKDSAKTEAEKSRGFMDFLMSKLPESLRAKKDITFGEQDVATMVKAAEKGDLDVQLFLGYAYLYGENGVAVDYDKTFKYYSMAAAQNDAIALNNLGSLYYNGIGVQRNTSKAAELFAKAADLGNADASVNLGFMLISGEGMRTDKSRALAYFEKASETDNPLARFMTGYAYYTGVLQPANDTKAAKFIKFAADAGFDEAQVVLANLYMVGRGFPQNYNTAMNYLRLAVAQGNVEAMMSEADILASGEKYPKDVEYAHVLYNLAAVRGATGAAEKRQQLESHMKIKDVLQSQLQAENYREQMTSLTAYVHQTFGDNVRGFVKQSLN